MLQCKEHFATNACLESDREREKEMIMMGMVDTLTDLFNFCNSGARSIEIKQREQNNKGTSFVCESSLYLSQHGFYIIVDVHHIEDLPVSNAE